MTPQPVAAFEVGDNLPAITKRLSQEKINRYADASGDHNPLHIDPKAASAGPFGGTIAHGMLILAYIAEMMRAAFGSAWDGELDVRFRAPARPGDTISASGRVIKTEHFKPDGSSPIVTMCEVECRNQNGEILISGKATARKW
jgi:3-hydroxybutyryl-CoA dehydratase